MRDLCAQCIGAHPIHLSSTLGNSFEFPHPFLWRKGTRFAPLCQNLGFPLAFLETQRCSANALVPTLVFVVCSLDLMCLSSYWLMVRLARSECKGVQQTPLCWGQFLAYTYPLISTLFNPFDLLSLTFLLLPIFSTLSNTFLGLFQAYSTFPSTNSCRFWGRKP